MNTPATIPSPLDSLRRQQWLLWSLAAPAFLAAAWWALGPLDTGHDYPILESLTSDPQARDVRGAPDRPPLPDQHTFAINLWAPPPPPEQAIASAPPAQPPPPLNIQLIGIITDSRDGLSIQKAALYDVDEDRLLIVADGDRVRDQTVRVLAGGVVELSDGQSSRRLMLRPDEERLGGPG